MAGLVYAISFLDSFLLVVWKIFFKLPANEIAFYFWFSQRWLLKSCLTIYFRLHILINSRKLKIKQVGLSFFCSGMTNAVFLAFSGVGISSTLICMDNPDHSDPHIRSVKRPFLSWFCLNFTCHSVRYWPPEPELRIHDLFKGFRDSIFLFLGAGQVTAAYIPDYTDSKSALQ